MDVTIAVTSKEAEMILFAIALRSKQAGISEQAQKDALEVGEHLNDMFEEAFGWDHFNRMAHTRKPIKRVTVTCYDYPPTS